MSNSVILKTFSSRAEAEIVCGLLRENGIAAIIQGDDCGGLQPALSLTAGVRLLVAKIDADRARELVEADHASDVNEADHASEPNDEPRGDSE